MTQPPIPEGESESLKKAIEEAELIKEGKLKALSFDELWGDKPHEGETTQDLISREAVLKVINERIERLDMRVDTLWELEELVDVIKAITPKKPSPQ